MDFIVTFSSNIVIPIEFGMDHELFLSFFN